MYYWEAVRPCRNHIYSGSRKPINSNKLVMVDPVYVLFKKGRMDYITTNLKINDWFGGLNDREGVVKRHRSSISWFIPQIAA